MNVGCHPDLDAARDLIGGAVAAFAHFSSMPGSTGAGLADADRDVVAEVGRRYDSNEHLSNTAAHTAALKPEFVDRFAVVGPPDVCASALRGLAELGIERFVITGASFRADREHRPHLGAAAHAASCCPMRSAENGGAQHERPRARSSAAGPSSTAPARRRAPPTSRSTAA